MARLPRISGPEIIHHITSRCNNQEFLFQEDCDYRYYLNLIKKAKESFDFRLYGYALLSNHNHLILHIGEKGDISEIMQRINADFAMWYNRRHNRKGHFWQGRFNSKVINDDNYLLRCSLYVDLNPVRAGIVNEPRSWKYSSVRTYTEGEKNDLVDISPTYLLLSNSLEDCRERYEELISAELERSKKIQSALGQRDKKEILRLLKNNPKEPIPYKKQILKLFGKSLNRILGVY